MGYKYTKKGFDGLDGESFEMILAAGYIIHCLNINDGPVESCVNINMITSDKFNDYIEKYILLDHKTDYNIVPLINSLTWSGYISMSFKTEGIEQDQWTMEYLIVNPDMICLDN